MQSEFPEFYSVYNGLPKSICRADVIRYLIMFKIGGLYLDLDYEMLKPFDLLDHAVVLPFSRQKDAGTNAICWAIRFSLPSRGIHFGKR